MPPGGRRNKLEPERARVLVSGCAGQCGYLGPAAVMGDPRRVAVVRARHTGEGFLTPRSVFERFGRCFGSTVLRSCSGLPIVFGVSCNGCLACRPQVRAIGRWPSGAIGI